MLAIVVASPFAATGARADAPPAPEERTLDCTPLPAGIGYLGRGDASVAMHITYRVLNTGPAGTISFVDPVDQRPYTLRFTTGENSIGDPAKGLWGNIDPATLPPWARSATLAVTIGQSDFDPGTAAADSPAHLYFTAPALPGETPREYMYRASCSDHRLIEGAQSERRRLSQRTPFESRMREILGGSVPDYHLAYDPRCGGVSAAVDWDRVCRDPEAAMRDLLDRRATDSCMRTGFENPPGLARSGLCWWHSTFQQHAWQLTTYAPRKPKPTLAHLRRLIARLYAGDQVIEFPGYANWMEVSLAARDLLTDVMNDEFINAATEFRSLRIWTNWEPSPARVFAYGREMEENYRRGYSTFIYARFSAFGTHAKVAYRVERRGNRLLIDLVDSNHPLAGTPTAEASGIDHLEITENGAGSATVSTPFAVYHGTPTVTWMTSHARFPGKTLRAWQDACARHAQRNGAGR